jgi:hypothetical protein
MTLERFLNVSLELIVVATDRNGGSSFSFVEHGMYWEIPDELIGVTVRGAL